MFVKTEVSALKLPQSPEEFVGSDNAAFCKAFEDPQLWATIPLLNYTPLHKLKDYSVVRFRGMIQDMLDPEIYLESYEVKKKEHSSGSGEIRMQPGKYRDCLLLGKDEEVNYHSETNVQGERRVLFVVSIPGINDWAKTYEENCNKRNVPEIITNGESSNRSIKRPVAEEEMDTECMDTEELTQCSSKGQTDTNKRQKVDQIASDGKTTPGSASSACLGADYLLNSPIPDRPSKACMVKVYSDFDSYIINTIVDVVGFLSVDPCLDGTNMDVDYDNVGELQAQNPPPSLIPRLHAIAVHVLPHANPLLDQRLGKWEADSASVISIQKDLRMLLTLCLFNDDLAADYLLSHLISTVYSRCELQSIGKFSLNICNLPKESVAEYTKQLYGILEQILPASHYLPMTLDTMNTAAFVPKKDYETNKLVSGLLQLAPHTHLVLDETRMQQGKLEANGVMGIQSIANLINNQQIKCNFQYYEIDYNVDIPVLILSEGRSMLPSDISLPLKTDTESVQLMTETLKAANHYLSQNSRLEQFRRYLTNAKTSDFTMNPGDTEMIQNDFVEMRKTNSVTSADDLHSLLVLSRLLAIARGKNVLDKESWELAKEMESKRRQRLSELPKSKLKTRQQ
ncbi:mini-chromosome maintenance complex-binding protein [Musca domestica]|uniref:Mini-chromosome maintenance complex-binding protein n=2 Tax=Musca domestica TaxID=7370 RepID=A0A1I8N5Q3_MUSDO|nr:mini-chromosome maintenance complex-binding protein [Musca domestica]